ncbi:hypothetical protein [Nocardia brasiliensis]|uniref:hypothetical protein n=1 Tax=Nocardia brasiliensis TaxID=37326 RepID=UPI002457DA20|nr:hypothetical protein [Nocardia brasiliensis]
MNGRAGILEKRGELSDAEHWYRKAAEFWPARAGAGDTRAQQKLDVLRERINAVTQPPGPA